MRRPGVRRFAIVVAALGLANAACRPRASVTAVQPQACALAPAADAVVRAATLAVTSPLDVDAILHASDAAARSVFDRAYETLVRIDCTGQVLPGLAEQWTERADTVELTLRAGARFWSGESVTAAAVLTAWRQSAGAQANRLVRTVVDSARAIDAYTIRIAHRSVTAAWLASSAFVVVRTDTGRVLEGTGPMRLIENVPPGVNAGPGRAFRLSLALGGEQPDQFIGAVDRTAARDAIDRGDVTVMTSDPALVAYASARGQYAESPLEWDRVWVLVAPALASDATSEASSAFTAALASDAIGPDARPARLPAWLHDARFCGRAPDTPVTPLAAARLEVAYLRDDPVARAIAERLVALTAMDTDGHPLSAAAPSRVVSLPLDAPSFLAALSAPRARAFVLSVPSRNPSPCPDLVHPLGAMHWLAGPGGRVRQSTLIPLVETRWRVLAPMSAR